MPQVCPQGLVARGVLGAEGGDIRRVGRTVGFQSCLHFLLFCREGGLVGGFRAGYRVGDEVACTLQVGDLSARGCACVNHAAVSGYFPAQFLDGVTELRFAHII